MPRLATTLLAACFVWSALPAYATDVCALMTRAEASSALGQTVSNPAPSGPERDEDSGGQLSYCIYRSSNAALIVSLVEFASVAEARKQFNEHLVEERMEAEDAKISEEKGIGEKAFWGISSNGAMVVFLMKSKVVGIGVGGIDKPASRKDALRTAATSLAAKN